MCQDLNGADIELYCALKQFFNKEQNRRARLNVAAALAKSVLSKYMFETRNIAMRFLSNNIVSGLKVCISLLEKSKIQSKVSDFLQQCSVETVRQLINKYIVSHSIK